MKKIVRVKTFFLCLAFWLGLFQIVNASEKSKFVLVKDAKPAVTIVIANNPSQVAAFAAQELQYHVKKITGVCLPIVTDKAFVQGPRVLVGASLATKKMGINEKKLKNQEYLIEFYPDMLVLLGKDSSKLYSGCVSVCRKLIWTKGKFGNALEFNGNNTGLLVKQRGFRDEEGTLEAWVWLPAQRPKITQVILRIDGGYGYNIIQRPANTDKIQFANYGRRKFDAISSKKLSEGWHHVMANYSLANGKMELFVDGEFQGTAPYKSAGCKDRNLSIGGGVMAKYKHVGNPFLGKIDEVKVSSVKRTPKSSDLEACPESDANTLLLLHFDENQGQPSNSNSKLYAEPPAWNQEQATSYAVHDFLENFCGVRWFGPTDLLMDYPKSKTLEVKTENIRRTPGFKLRCLGPRAALDRVRILWNDPDKKELSLFWARQRLGGEAVVGCHSFGGFYPRFWAKDSRYPNEFVKHEPKWFSQVKTNPPPQMCFTNPGFSSQVIKDAKEYFDTGKVHIGGQGLGNYFSLCPQDNNRYCPCPKCRGKMNDREKKNPQFSNGYASDYIFGFINKVANELKKTHPDKYISALAYWDYAYPPEKVELPPNVSITMCLHTRSWWAPAMKRSDMNVYRSWLKKYKKHRLFLWLYYCFPELNARSGNFNCFPGYFAHTQAKQIKMFAKDGIRGMHPGGGSGWLVDSYVMYKLLDNPNLDVDDILDDLFTRLYGPAAEPMKKIYLRIEDIYSNSKNYPRTIQTENRTFHQNEEIAWKYLGTKKRMAELANLMIKAEQLAQTDKQKKRVALFRKGVWNYMVEGRRKYLVKQAQNPKRAKLMVQSPFKCDVPRIPYAMGNSAKINWSKAAILKPWYTLQGYTSSRNIEGKLAHDGKYLYIQLQENFGFLNTVKLLEKVNIWTGDDWEIFFAPARKKPYFQLCIAPSGKYIKNIVGADKWNCNAKVISDTSAPDRWKVYVVIPLSHIIPGGIKSGDVLYANFGRGSNTKGHMIWSPNFSNSFQVPARFGKLTFQ
jgi:hypothetical protein